EGRQVEDRGADAGPEQHGDGGECERREARYAEGQARESLGGGKAAPEDEQADQAADPERAGGEVQPVEGERERARRRLCGVPGRARGQQHCSSGEERTEQREELGDRAPRRLAAVETKRDRGRDCEERQQELEVEVAAAER